MITPEMSDVIASVAALSCHLEHENLLENKLTAYHLYRLRRDIALAIGDDRWAAHWQEKINSPEAPPERPTEVRAIPAPPDAAAAMAAMRRGAAATATKRMNGGSRL